MRGFLGGFGGFGGGNSGLKSSGASADMKKQLLKGGKTAETQQEKMKKMIEAKRDAMNEEIMKGNGKKFQLPGTKQGEGSGLSKTAKKMMQMIAEKKAKEKMKKEAAMVAVKKRSYDGGYMSEDGKIYNAAGKVVATVDMKSGNIKNGLGMTVGKYKDDFFGNGKIQKIIANSAAKKPATSAGSIYGTMSTPSSTGSIYGTFDDKKDDSWW
jgi:hypothetical protein